MTINASGRMFRIAYAATPRREWPQQVNLCRFFWKLIGMGIGVVTIWITCFVLICIVDVLAFLLCGYRVNLGPGPILFVPIKRWPNFQGKHIFPIAVLGIFVGIPVLLCVIGYTAWLLILCMDAEIGFLFMGKVTAILVVLLLATAGIRKLIKSEFGHLAKEYLKAKKAHVCPIITIDYSGINTPKEKPPE